MNRVSGVGLGNELGRAQGTRGGAEWVGMGCGCAGSQWRSIVARAREVCGGGCADANLESSGESLWGIACASAASAVASAAAASASAASAGGGIATGAALSMCRRVDRRACGS